MEKPKRKSSDWHTIHEQKSCMVSTGMDSVYRHVHAMGSTDMYSVYEHLWGL